MKSIALDSDDIRFYGLFDLEAVSGGFIPWRLPLKFRHLYHPALECKAKDPSGVRIVFLSDTSNLKFSLSVCTVEGQGVDLVVDGELFQTQRFIDSPDKEFVFAELPEGEKRIELWLPTFDNVVVKSLEIDDSASCRSFEDSRKRWITYGSSITQCRGAWSPTHAWPAIVSKNLELNLTSMGFGGQCHFDQTVARAIAAREVDYINMCLGINTYGGSFSPRTWAAAVIGFILTVRDGHPATPITLTSPIYSPDREGSEGATGMTLVLMRQWLQEIIENMRCSGDNNLYYINGLEIFSEDDSYHLPDCLHPSSVGYQMIGDRMTAKIKDMDFWKTLQ